MYRSLPGKRTNCLQIIAVQSLHDYFLICSCDESRKQFSKICPAKAGNKYSSRAKEFVICFTQRRQYSKFFVENCAGKESGADKKHHQAALTGVVFNILSASNKSSGVVTCKWRKPLAYFSFGFVQDKLKKLGQILMIQASALLMTQAFCMKLLCSNLTGKE